MHSGLLSLAMIHYIMFLCAPGGVRTVGRHSVCADANIDSVTFQFRIARIECDGSLRMRIPAGIIIVIPQLITDLDDREVAAHREVIAKGALCSSQRNGVM